MSQPSVEKAAQHREKLRGYLDMYRSHGAELVRDADARQKMLKDFWNCFEALDARTKESLAQSWKIFGRVIARKSLVDLNSSLDGIRRSFASLPARGLYDQGALDAVTANVRALAASLKANEAALIHSQGASWVRQVNADAAKLDALRESLIRMDAQRRATESNFSKESQNLVALTNATGPLPIGRDGNVAKDRGHVAPRRHHRDDFNHRRRAVVRAR